MRRILLLMMTSFTLIAAQGQITSLNCSDKDSLHWVSTPVGCLHLYTYFSEDLSRTPVLVVVLHGDAPFTKPGYQYLMAKKIAAQNKNTISIGLLRPGYSDPDSNTSKGKRGFTTGDNYTIENIEAIASAIHQFQLIYHPSKTILVGHSGGSAITADIIALKPGLIDKAVIVSCPCNVPDWRNYMSKRQPAVSLWKDSVTSISPLAVADQIKKTTEVLLISGEKDDVAPTRYSIEYDHKLRSNGIKSSLIIVPGEGHEILLHDSVLASIKKLIAE
jgi:pimeloyl-ACP methyl ester carboxylesterase